ncbi:MAG: ABC transporter substrate-binding protein [Oscillospiraceae bacterium]|jgi:iron complex transport system substrate-binding protein|nr:ABC transporter substrate-binding protein [Oscillospiraceae bacterium]
MKTYTRSVIALILTALLAFSMVACSSAPAESTPTPTADNTPAEGTPTDAATPDDSADSEYPIVIQHAFGETVIEKKPERVATIAWANQDTPLALGVVPVGFSMANFGPVDAFGNHPWTAAKLAELGVTEPNVFQDTDGYDYEAISDTNPDIILAAYSGITQEEYDLLSQIAPVVAYPRQPWQTYWRELVLINSEAIGMKAEGEQYVAETEALIAEKVSQYPQLDDKTGAFLWIDATNLSTFYLYFTIDPRASYLTDLGISFPESLDALKTDDTSFAATVSAENIDILYDLDIIVAYGDATLLETLQADALFGTVPAVQRGSVALIDSNTELAGAATPSALSIPAVIDEYLGLLAEAADKVK